MAIKEVESYQRLQEDYERKLAEYQEAEAAYRQAAAEGGVDPRVAAQYEALKVKRNELDGLYEQLKEMRNHLAHAREEALQRVASATVG